MQNIDDKQVRHEMLIDFISQFTLYQTDSEPRLPKVNKLRMFDDVQNIDTNHINASICLLIDSLNIYSGSTGDIDLYDLVQTYLTKPESRELINEALVKSRRLTK